MTNPHAPALTSDPSGWPRDPEPLPAGYDEDTVCVLDTDPVWGAPRGLQVGYWTALPGTNVEVLVFPDAVQSAAADPAGTQLSVHYRRRS